MELVPCLRNNKDSTFNKRSFTNDKGTLEGTVEDNNGKKSAVEYKLTKENDEWRIDEIRIIPPGN